MIRLISAAAVAAFLAAPAMAEPTLGTWVSPPDNKGQTGHVVVRKCGSGVCGTLERAYSSTGKQITTKNVGKQLLSNMVPQGSGVYKGRAYVPIFGKTFEAEMRLAGNTLKIKGCAGPVCKTQNWKRVN